MSVLTNLLTFFALIGLWVVLTGLLTIWQDFFPRRVGLMVKAAGEEVAVVMYRGRYITFTPPTEGLHEGDIVVVLMGGSGVKKVIEGKPASL